VNAWNVVDFNVTFIKNEEPQEWKVAGNSETKTSSFVYSRKKKSCGVRWEERGLSVRAASALPYPWEHQSQESPIWAATCKCRGAFSSSNSMANSSNISTSTFLCTLHQSKCVLQIEQARKRSVWIQHKVTEPTITACVTPNSDVM